MKITKTPIIWILIGIGIIIFLYILVNKTKMNSIEGACTNNSDSTYARIRDALSNYSNDEIVTLSTWVKTHATFNRIPYNGCYSLGAKNTKGDYVSLATEVLLQNGDFYTGSSLSNISYVNLSDLFSGLNNKSGVGDFSFDKCLEYAKKYNRTSFGISQTDGSDKSSVTGRCYMSIYDVKNENGTCIQNSDGFKIGDNHSVGSYAISSEYDNLTTAIKYADYAIDDSKTNKLDYCIMALKTLNCSLNTLGKTNDIGTVPTGTSSFPANINSIFNPYSNKFFAFA